MRVQCLPLEDPSQCKYTFLRKTTSSQLPHILHRSVIDMSRTDEVVQQCKDHDRSVDQTCPVHLRHGGIICAWEEGEDESDDQEAHREGVEEDTHRPAQSERRWEQRSVGQSSPQDKADGDDVTRPVGC